MERAESESAEVQGDATASGEQVAAGAPFPEAEAGLARATVAWRLPRLQKFTGEKMQEEDRLKSIIREFERHAKLSKWSEEKKRLRFEIQLGGRALRMYKSLGDEDRRTYI